MSSCCAGTKSICEVKTSREECPRCGKHGRPVGAETVRAILKPALAAAARDDVAYRFCANPGCSLLYYDGSGWSAGKEDATVRVGIKETNGVVPLCYCFGFTKAQVLREVAATGRSAIPERITALVKAGECACEVKNPSGACCLGEVRKAVKEATEALAEVVSRGGLQ